MRHEENARPTPVGRPAKVDRPTRPLVAITLGALVIRVWYVLAYQHLPITSDGLYAYHVRAARLVEGGGMGDYSWAPGWTYLLTIPTRLGVDTILGHQVLGAVITTAAVPLIGLVGWEVGGRRVAIAAAAVAAVFPHFIVYPRELMSETPTLPLYAASLWLTYRMIKAPRACTALLLGASLGLQILMRADALLLAPILLATLLWAARRVPWRPRLGLVVLAGATALVLVVPWSIHVSQQTGRFVPVATSSGRTLAAGSCDLTFAGERLGFMHVNCTYGPVVRARRRGEGTTQPEVDVILRRAWWDYTTDHLGEVPLVVLAREGRMLGVFRPGQTIDFAHVDGDGVPTGWVWASFVGFWACVPLAIVGARRLRRRRVPIGPLLAGVVTALVIAMMTFGLPRYRLFADVGVVVLAACGAVAVWDRFRPGVPAPSTGRGGRSMSVVRRVHQRVVWGRRVEAIATSIASILPPRGRVLDVGSGDGAVAAATTRRLPGVEVTGVDVVVRPATHIPVERFDGHRLPFEDDSFDAVTFVDVLHHTDEQHALLAEAARVAPIVVIKDHLADGFLARPTLRLMDWGGNTQLGVALPYNYWTEREWEDAFRQARLVVDTRLTELGLYPAPLSWAFERQLHAVWRLHRYAG